MIRLGIDDDIDAHSGRPGTSLIAAVAAGLREAGTLMGDAATVMASRIVDRIAGADHGAFTTAAASAALRATPSPVAAESTGHPTGSAAGEPPDAMLTGVTTSDAGVTDGLSQLRPRLVRD